MSEPRKIIYEDWIAEAEALFGPDKMKWKFVCPCCGHVASTQDWKDAGASVGEVAFSCVGRHMPNPRDAFGRDTRGGPCNYTGGGLFKLNPVTVVINDNGEVAEHTVFEFAKGE